MRVPVKLVHADDRGPLVDGMVDLAPLRGRTVRMKAKAVMQILGTSGQTHGMMVELGLLELGEKVGSDKPNANRWVLMDPAATKRSLYDAFVPSLGVPRTHEPFDRYQRARNLCGIPGAELPPPNIAEGMVPLLLEIGSTNPSEIGAFTPHHDDNERELQAIVRQRAARIMSTDDRAGGFRPTDAMVLDAAPGLANAPGTVFDRLFGGTDLARPKDPVLRRAWALERLRGAALLWSYLAAASRRRGAQISVAVLHLSILDRALVAADARADDPAAIAAALEEIAFGPAWDHLRPQTRAIVVQTCQVTIRQLATYAARNDPDGSKGIAALVPAQQPDRLGLATRVTEAYGQLAFEGREARKRRSDRAADIYARMVDVAALRIEQVTLTQMHAEVAAKELLDQVASGQGGDPFVEFGVETTVMTPKGRLLAGAQTCWWRAWRERDLILELARREPGLTFNEGGPLYKRLQTVKRDPDALTGIVFEWMECVPLDGDEAIEPWFVTISNAGVLNAPNSLPLEQREARHRLIREWHLPAYDRSVGGLLNFGREDNTLWRLASRRGTMVVPVTEFAFAMRYAALGLNTVDETLCRISEFLQMRQDRDMWPTSGETGSEEVGFLAIPKSSRTVTVTKPVPFQVSQVTFVEALELAGEIAMRDGHPDGVLPEVAANHALLERYPEPQAWIFQSRGRAVTGGSMNRFLAFLLGNVVDVTFHELRHAASNAAREAGVPEESIQRLMNHRSPIMTRWYFRRTSRQRARAEVGRARRIKVRSGMDRAKRLREKKA